MPAGLRLTSGLVFKRQPGFGAAVVLVLGLSIGLTSALFAVVNALFHRHRWLLGAQTSSVLRLVLRRVTVAAAFGVARGFAGAFALRKVIAAQSIGVSAADPVYWAR
jgi:hypothetical protein